MGQAAEGAPAEAEADGPTLFQPMRDDVDLEAPVEVTEVEPRFAGRAYHDARRNFPKALRNAIVGGGPYVVRRERMGG